MILIDEFSTGIDAKMKRDMWGTLKSVALGKAVVITTREFLCMNTCPLPCDLTLRKTLWRKRLH